MSHKLDQSLIDEFVTTSLSNLGKVRQLLLKHPDLIDARATWGDTAVEAAIKAGQNDIAEFLLSAGATLKDCLGLCKDKVQRLNQDYQSLQ